MNPIRADPNQSFKGILGEGVGMGPAPSFSKELPCTRK